MPVTEPAWVASLRHTLVRLDGFMVCASLTLLLLLVLAQVLMRNLFDGGIRNADILSRYLVLYVTFFGAALAIEEHKHIRLDILAVFFEADRTRALMRPLYLISAIVCAVAGPTAKPKPSSIWIAVAATAFPPSSRAALASERT